MTAIPSNNEQIIVKKCPQTDQSVFLRETTMNLYWNATGCLILSRNLDPREESHEMIKVARDLISGVSCWLKFV
jgi:hypothetical protein